MKRIICFVVLILSAGSAFAQLYVRGNIGYNLPANAQNIGTNYKEIYNEGTGEFETSNEVVNGSFGSGLSFNLGFGASINGTIGYDVDLGYLLGKEYSTNYRYVVFDTETEDSEMKSSSFQIAPSLTFTSGTGNIQPYTRMGPVLGFTKLKYTESRTDTYPAIDEKKETELSGGISFGFKGVLGVTLNAEKKIQFYGEVNFLSMSYAPKEGEITAYTANGQDALSSLSKEERNFEFKDKLSNDDNPYTQLREKHSMGSFGIQVGVKYVLK